MATERNLVTAAYKADGAITKYRVVVAGTADGEVAQGSTAGTVVPWGVAAGTAADDGMVDVHVGGTAKACAGAAITKGAKVTFDANGKVIAATAATEHILGFAEKAAAADGDLIPVRIALMGLLT